MADAKHTRIPSPDITRSGNRTRSNALSGGERTPRRAGAASPALEALISNFHAAYTVWCDTSERYEAAMLCVGSDRAKARLHVLEKADGLAMRRLLAAADRILEHKPRSYEDVRRVATAVTGGDQRSLILREQMTDNEGAGLRVWCRALVAADLPPARAPHPLE